MLGPAGLLLADVGMVPSGASAINPALNARQTMVATKQDGEWHMALFQNTPAALDGDEAARARLSEGLEAALRGPDPMPGTG